VKCKSAEFEEDGREDVPEPISSAVREGAEERGDRRRAASARWGPMLGKAMVAPDQFVSTHAK